MNFIALYSKLIWLGIIICAAKNCTKRADCDQGDFCSDNGKCTEILFIGRGR
uniref:Uncharacterized protein n=1 Tax=Tetranychus urticae TaxID=32264 RepID=T1KLZ2_TETUR